MEKSEIEKLAEEILKGKGFRARNVNLAEPPGGTFRAYHKEDVIQAMLEMWDERGRKDVEAIFSIPRELDYTVYAGWYSGKQRGYENAIEAIESNNLKK